MTLGVRVGFFGYWLFDNLLILAKLKLFNKPAKSFLKPAMFCWWTALMFNLIMNLRKLSKLKKHLKSMKKIIGNDPEKKKQFETDLKGIFDIFIL